MLSAAKHPEALSGGLRLSSTGSFATLRMTAGENEDLKTRLHRRAPTPMSQRICDCLSAWAVGALALMILSFRPTLRSRTLRRNNV
jgi:hypothetical protein